MLTGQAKTDYQREYMRRRRSNKKSAQDPVRPEPTILTPFYNPSKHKIGDRVLVYQGKRLIETVIPEIDAKGNMIPEI